MKCSATAEDGMPCLAEAWGDSIYCLMHDPSPSARRRHGEMSRRGGTSSRATAKPVDLTVDTSSAEGILRSLEAVGTALARGDLDRSRANSISYILATAVQARKVLDYEHRLKRVEKRLGLKVNPLEETEDDDGQPA